MRISLKINNRPVTVDVPPEMPLLWVLRDVLDLKGAKYGCGMAMCGACTIHLNGDPVRSCTLPVLSAKGQSITTIEGLSSDGSHPVQRAWDEVDVAQCGYCQAGQIMAAAALLKKNPDPSDQDITEAMEGNLCRCGTYVRVREAIHQAVKLAATTSTGRAPAPTP